MGGQPARVRGAWAAPSTASSQSQVPLVAVDPHRPAVPAGRPRGRAARRPGAGARDQPPGLVAGAVAISLVHRPRLVPAVVIVFGLRVRRRRGPRSPDGGRRARTDVADASRVTASAASSWRRGRRSCSRSGCRSAPSWGGCCRRSSSRRSSPTSASPAACTSTAGSWRRRRCWSTTRPAQGCPAPCTSTSGSGCRTGASLTWDELSVARPAARGRLGLAAGRLHVRGPGGPGRRGTAFVELREVGALAGGSLVALGIGGVRRPAPAPRLISRASKRAPPASRSGSPSP